MKRAILTMLLAAVIAGLPAVALAAAQGEAAADVPRAASEQAEEDDAAMKQTMLKIKIGQTVLLAELADTDAARALAQKLAEGDVTIAVSNYGGWEKVGGLPWELPAADEQLAAQPGDIMLYTGSSIVLFYGENSWAYTRLGRIVSHDAEALRPVLSGDDSEATLSLAEE